MAKEFLSQNRIHFEEKDIDLDAGARNELAKSNISGVPAFFIGNDVIVGLDKDKILKLANHRLVECDQCGTKLRVPLDKGVLKVTCPKCKNLFPWDPGK
jgi:glutaredoxin 3